ncbi:hypothetical protein ACXWOM_10065, partial [Streptococcus pyogenes]
EREGRKGHRIKLHFFFFFFQCSFFDVHSGVKKYVYTPHAVVIREVEYEEGWGVRLWEERSLENEKLNLKKKFEKSVCGTC